MPEKGGNKQQRRHNDKREIDSEMDRVTNCEKDRQSKWEEDIEWQKDINKGRKKDRKIVKQNHRKTGGQTVRQTERKKDM